jgi:hypothetical protein
MIELELTSDIISDSAMFFANVSRCWSFGDPSCQVCHVRVKGPARQLSKGLGSGSWFKQSSQLVHYGFSFVVLFCARWLLYESALQCTESG